MNLDVQQFFPIRNQSFMTSKSTSNLIHQVGFAVSRAFVYGDWQTLCLAPVHLGGGTYGNIMRGKPQSQQVHCKMGRDPIISHSSHKSPVLMFVLPSGYD